MSNEETLPEALTVIFFPSEHKYNLQINDANVGLVGDAQRVDFQALRDFN